MKSRYLLGALLMSSCLVAPGLAAAQAQDEVEEVVITGQRATDRDSLEKKREATSASEIVSGGEAGKLPDKNVAESVRRLSVVSVATDKGEGRVTLHCFGQKCTEAAMVDALGLTPADLFNNRRDVIYVYEDDTDAYNHRVRVEKKKSCPECGGRGVR